jgi:glycosyltransferase involved in cell wall biosynthesis
MTDQKPSPVAILYWGSRGGPVRQIQNLMMTAKNYDFDLHWIISSNISELDNDILSNIRNVVITKMPKSKLGLIFHIVERKKTIGKTIEYLKSNKIEKVYFLLPHPWDILLAKKLHLETNIEIWRGIHDLKRHPGDLWPTRRALRRTMKFANVLITFSSFVTDIVQGRGQRVMETSIFEPKRENRLASNPGSILFVGRIRRYKGLNLLKSAWPLVTNSNKSLTIAGEGQGIPFEPSDTVKIINRWLSDREIEDLISSHSLVVLPYIEASQSGIIPLANALGVPVVVTPVGGLASQIKQGINGLVSINLDHKEFAATIDRALSMEWHFEPEINDSLRMFLDALVSGA